MKRRWRTIVAGIMAAVICLCATPVSVSLADSAEVKPFIAFGADLTAKEKKTVMQQLGITDAELADYQTITVTNQEEHQYLDDYLASSVIGTRALSSVLIEEADAGSGIEVETHNISFCTEEMYTNALVTAGIEDAKVTVAGPFKLSGTAALVGAMKAYGAMTGDVIDSEQSDAATNELVLTGELGDAIGTEEATRFMATLKDKVIRDDLKDEQEILKAIDETAEQFDVTIDDNMKNKIASLMEKISGLDLDLNRIKDQAKGIYDKLADMDIDLGEAKGFLAKVKDFFSGIVDWFKNLF